MNQMKKSICLRDNVKNYTHERSLTITNLFMLDSDKHSINTSLIIPSLFDYAPTLGK